MTGWLAGLDAFAVGLAYLVALLTTRFVVRPLLVSVLGAAPFVGGWLTSHLDEALAGFERAITPAANASMGTLVSALDWLVEQVRAMLNGLVDLAEASYAAAWQMATHTLPAALQQTLVQAEGLVSDARGWALLQVQALEVRLGGELARVEAEATGLVGAARQEAQEGIQAAERTVLDEVRKVEQATGQLFLQAEHEAQLIGRQAEVVAAQIGQAERAFVVQALETIERDLRAVEEQAGAQLPELIGTVSKDVAALRAQTEAQIPELQRNLSQEIKDLEASAPWQLIAGLESEGQALLAQGLRGLLDLERKALRSEIAGAQILQAKLAPFVRALSAEIKAGR